MSKQKPAISVITPVWNGLPYIKEAVDSVLSQDFDNWELIISDNGSTDATRDYLDTLKDPRITVYKQQRNLGIDGNLNFLTTKTNSDYAYFLCADDYLLPGALKNVVKEWNEAPENTAYIVFNWKIILDHGIKGKYSYEVLPKFMEPSISQLAFFLFGNFPGNLSNLSTRISYLLNSGGFDEHYKMAGDFEMWARLASKHNVLLSDTPTSYIRRHEGTASNYLNKQGRQFLEQAVIYEYLIDKLSNKFERARLIDYFNIEICSFHFRESIRHLLFNGRINYLNQYVRATSNVFWPKWKRLVVSLPHALNERARMLLLIKMAGEMIRENAVSTK